MSVRDVESGEIYIRDIPQYNEAPNNWWTRPTCMMCKKKCAGRHFIGYGLHYSHVKQKLCSMGAHYFCHICEQRHRIIARTLYRHGLVAINREDWEKIRSVAGTNLTQQLYRVSTAEGNAKSFYNQFERSLAYEAYCMQTTIEEHKPVEAVAEEDLPTQVVPREDAERKEGKRKMKQRWERTEEDQGEEEGDEEDEEEGNSEDVE